MSVRIAVLNGDGIGPEVVPSAVEVLRRAAEKHHVELDLAPLPIGSEAIEVHRTAVPSSTLDALADCDGWLLGPHDSESYPEEFRGEPTPSGVIRKHFDLYANLRPSYTLPGTPSLKPAIDLVVVRENTEGFYADRNMFRGIGEAMPTPDVALATGVFTRTAITRIAHSACRLAMRRRQQLDIIHKANVLRMTSGLFLRVCREVAAEYPGLTVGDYHVDNAAALLVRDPERFDVLVCENMFGDILSDLTAELVGGLGLAPSINSGEDRAMAQATHGSAPDIAGKGIANPTAEMLSTAMLIDWIADRRGDDALFDVARCISDSVAAALAAGNRTRDLGGTAGTAEFTDAVLAQVDGWTRQA
jgi:3-isopropylmalate dehydrogenase